MFFFGFLKLIYSKCHTNATLFCNFFKKISITLFYAEKICTILFYIRLRKILLIFLIYLIHHSAFYSINFLFLFTFFLCYQQILPEILYSSYSKKFLCSIVFLFFFFIQLFVFLFFLFCSGSFCSIYFPFSKFLPCDFSAKLKISPPSSTPPFRCLNDTYKKCYKKVFEKVKYRCLLAYFVLF